MTDENTGSSRRDFLYLAGALAIDDASGQNRVKAVDSVSPQIGILLATTFTTGTLEARLDAVKANGLSCVQMSMAAAGLPEMPDQIPADLPDIMRRESSARRIVIASMTGTFNMTHPDEERRRTGLRRLRVLAEACPRIGTSFIHVCTGTRDPNNMCDITRITAHRSHGGTWPLASARRPTLLGRRTLFSPSSQK